MLPPSDSKITKEVIWGLFDRKSLIRVLYQLGTSAAPTRLCTAVNEESYHLVRMESALRGGSGFSFTAGSRSRDSRGQHLDRPLGG